MSTTKETKLQHTLASQCASALSTVILFPLDVVKVRYMSQDGVPNRNHNSHYYRSMYTSFRLIAKEEGLFKPFFRGCHVAVLGGVCAWGIYMYVYQWQREWYKRYLSKLQEKETVKTSKIGDLLQRFGFSIIASCTSAVVCNPIWVIKTRMQLEERALSKGEKRGAHYTSFRKGVRYAVQQGGVRSLWSGVSAQVLLGVPMAFNLPLYETIKRSLLDFKGTDNLDSISVAACSFISRTLLMIVTHPIVVMKTRLQDHRARQGEVQYKSLGQTFVTVWRRGGIRDFYRGMVPSLVQAVPRSVLLFVFYEKFLLLFSSFN